MYITWMGTASFVFETKEARILFDPFVQLNGAEHPNTLDDFLQEEVVFITHGHFDHLCFVPEILDRSEATVFCSQVPAKTLEELAETTDRIARFEIGQTIPIGDMRITSYLSRHIEFDKRYLPQTADMRSVIRRGTNLPFLAYANHRFQEGGETLAYEIEAEGRRIMLMGSLGLDASVAYPKEPDVLVLPYQGCNDLLHLADEIIGRIRPKSVLLSHFDNAFPPLSRTVDLKPLRSMMQHKYPDIRLVRPTYGKTIELKPASQSKAK